MSKDTLVLAHYYTSPEVQQMADYVGDSLDLAIKARGEKAKRIVFAGVRFMAETAKILNPEAEVILPDSNSTCSLVEQTNIDELVSWVAKHKKDKDVVHVAYINSSAEHKATADIIVTSRIVDDVISKLYQMGKKVIFSPDRNMGEYLNFEFGYNMPVWTAVCEVHDKFKADELELAMRHWTDGVKRVIAHPESPLPVLKKADYIGSTHGMMDWIRKFPYSIATIWVATEDGLLYNMRKERPDLDIRQAPTYTGCPCNVCPYMKMNTELRVTAAMNGIGRKIDYLTTEQIDKAYVPIKHMLDYQQQGELNV